jgi:cytochrome P450
LLNPPWAFHEQSDIVHATLEGEDPLTLEELLAIVTILPVAGTETSAGLIGMTLHHLLRSPE